MATIKERIDNVTENVTDGKTDIASAITELGVSASSDETFNSLANKILETKKAEILVLDETDLTNSGRTSNINATGNTLETIERMMECITNNTPYMLLYYGNNSENNAYKISIMMNVKCAPTLKMFTFYYTIDNKLYYILGNNITGKQYVLNPPKTV